MAAASLGSFLYINDTHGTAWTRVAAVSDGGGGEVWNNLTYVTNTQAWVVYGPADTAALASPGTPTTPAGTGPSPNYDSSAGRCGTPGGAPARSARL